MIVRQGCELPVKELDCLLALLMDKKKKMEQEAAETNMQILQDFLHCLRKQKLEELNQVLELEFIPSWLLISCLSKLTTFFRTRQGIYIY